MNPRFMKMVKENTPEIDIRLRNGLAYYEGKKSLAYINRLMRIHASSFPECFRYIGIERCTPEEDYNHTTRVRDNQRRYDVCRNDLRLCKLMFEFTTPTKVVKQIDVKLYLPFIRRHGLFYLNDTLYGITPVVSDVVFTVKPDRIFAKLLKIKLWFERAMVPYVVDGVTEYGAIFFSQIYNKKEEADGHTTVKMKHTLIHYLLAKYGLTKTLQMFGIENYQFLTREDYLKGNYPREEWVVVESTGLKPKRTYTGRFFEPMRTLFVVNRQEFMKDETLSQNVFCGLIHIMEHFHQPRRINPANVNDVNTWRNTLSEVLKPGEEHISARMEFIDKHMASLDEYIDEIVKEDLKSIGTNITNMYELLVYIVKNFQPLTSNANKHNTGNSLYGKRLDVLSYLLSNISQQIVRAYFGLYGLKLEQERDPTKVIKEDDIMKCLKNIRTNEILRIKKDHTELMVVDDPTDLPLLKLGRIVVPQEKSDRIKTGKDTFNVNDPRNVLTVSLLECGAALDMSKGDPAGFNRINLFLKLDENNKIVPNPRLAPIMREFARDLEA